MFILLTVQNKMSTDNIVLISIITLVASISASAVQLPFILKYGADKGKLIMVITYFVIFALATFLKEKTDVLIELPDFFSKSSMSMIFTGGGTIHSSTFGFISAVAQ